MRIKETPVYKFDELSPAAKERARDWWRQGIFSDSSYWDYIYEDAVTCADILGINLRTRSVQLMGGGTRNEPCIYFSGFSSQGDGACFEGTYAYAKGCARAIKRHAPEDRELANIASRLVALQRAHFYTLEARTEQRGRHNHSGCMSVEVWARDSADVSDAAESELTDILRAFADWIYSQLKQEYQWRMADEQVDDDICANEYEFDEEGKIA